MRKTLFSYAVAVVALSAIACGELTGPESPSTPTNVIATLASPTSVTLTWTPSPLNDGVISYSIYRNGNKVGETVGTEATYTDTGLSPQTTYVYSVAANCVGGVISERSAETDQSTVTTIDVTAPTVVQVIPVEGFLQVSPAADVTVIFSEPMDPATINTTTLSIRVSPNGPAIPGTVTYNAETRRAVLVPTNALPNFTTIVATMSTGAKDLAGNPLAQAKVWTFRTRDDIPPTVIDTNPDNGATGVPPNSVVTITFSEDMDVSTINATNITIRPTASGTALTAPVTYNATTRTATLTPSAPLSQNVSYTVTVGTGVKDAQGNAIAQTTFSFTAGDVTAPSVTSTTPADNATGVAVNTTVTATFSEPMDPATINTTTFTVRPTSSGTNLAGTVSYNAGTSTATFTPSAPLASATQYTATVTTGARDAAGNPMTAAKTWTFTTADVVPPTVASIVPGSGAAGVALNTTVTVTFSEAMLASTINNTTITLRPTSSATPVAATVVLQSGGTVAVLTPSAPLSPSTSYTVTVTTGVRDLSNNALATQVTSSFMTLTPDNTPPQVSGVQPPNLATGVATNATVQVTFNEAMDVTTITNVNIILRNTLTTAQVPATVSYDPNTRIATLTPTAPLSNLTNYTLTVTTAVKDASGNQLAAPFNSTFTTVAPPDNTAPTIVSRTPTNGATSQPINTNVVITFSEPMDPATLTTSTITLTPTGGGAAITGTVTPGAGNTTATFDPTNDLAYNTSYTVTITTNVKDVAGNAVVGTGPQPLTSTFTTIQDTVAPTVIARTPTAATGVAAGTNITVTFSEAMDVSSINGTTFTVTRTTGGGLPDNVIGGISNVGNVFTFNPSSDLMAGQTYLVTVTTGAKDLAGNSLTGTFSFSFTVANP